MTNKAPPLVSIVCNTYNHESYIRLALEGFLSQKVDFPIEILIHDDASTDGTAEIIKEYELKYPELIFAFYQKENKKSKGIKPFPAYQLPRARGKYIAACEGDDYWTSPVKLQEQVDFLENNHDYAICFHEAQVQYETQQKQPHLYSEFPWNHMSRDINTYTIADAIKGPFMATASIVYRRELLPVLPAFYNQAASGDVTLAILVTGDYKIKFINKVWSVYLRHPSGITASHRGDWIYLNRINTLVDIYGYFNKKYQKEIKCSIEAYLNSLQSRQAVPADLKQTLEEEFAIGFSTAKSLPHRRNYNSFCTIITKSHIPYAIALFNSIRTFDDKAQLNVLISDSGDKVQSPDPGLVFYDYEDLNSDETCQKLAAKYRESYHDAFRWSMKPIFLKFLLQSAPNKKVIYVDSDVHFFNDYNFLFKELDSASVLLTPHWRSRDPFIDKANFDCLLTSGHFNGGFVGVRKDAIPALEWWAKSCTYKCEVDPAKGHFVDQTYLDLFPVLFEDVKIIRHKGCNVANWNRVECKRTRDNKGNVLINNIDPIVFVHFTASTVRGILNGEDPLLAGCLKTYAFKLNQIDETINIIPKGTPSKILKSTSSTTTINEISARDLNGLIDKTLDNLKVGNYQQAIRMIEQAATSNSIVRDLEYVRGLCFLAVEKKDLARQALESELQHFPDNLPARKTLLSLLP